MPWVELTINGLQSHDGTSDMLGAKTEVATHINEIVTGPCGTLPW